MKHAGYLKIQPTSYYKTNAHILLATLKLSLDQLSAGNPADSFKNKIMNECTYSPHES